MKKENILCTEVLDTVSSELARSIIWAVIAAPDVVILQKGRLACAYGGNDIIWSMLHLTTRLP